MIQILPLINPHIPHKMRQGMSPSQNKDKNLEKQLKSINKSIIYINKSIQKENNTKLTLEENYSFIDMDYSNEEKKILENIKIKKNLFLTKFGNFQSLEEELKESIDEVEIVAKIINKLINIVIKSFK